MPSSGAGAALLDTELSEEQRDFASTIRNSSEALLTIINDVSSFSKIEAGRMDIEDEPFDLRDCVESALDLVRVAAPRSTWTSRICSRVKCRRLSRAISLALRQIFLQIY